MLNKIYELNPEIAFRLNVKSENISGKAFNSDTDILHEFSAEATEILNLVDGEKSVKDILSILLERYDIPEEVLTKDLEDFIGELEKLNIIQIRK